MTSPASVAVLLAEGFEEAEAIILINALCRLRLSVTTLSVGSERVVTSYHNMKIEADALLSAHEASVFDAVIVPGGPAGARNLGKTPAVIDFIRRHDELGKYVCAICSGGAHVLAGNGLLRGRRYTCSGENYKLYADGVYVNQDIVQDGNLVSARGLGLAFQLGFYVAALLTTPEQSQAQAEHIYVNPGPLPQAGFCGTV